MIAAATTTGQALVRMRVNTQMATPPTAASNTIRSATAPPLTLLLLAFSVSSVVDVVVDSSSGSVVVLRRTDVSVVVVVSARTLDVVDPRVGTVIRRAVVGVALTVVVVGFAVVADVASVVSTA
jgi:hypothetical protein